MHKTKGETLIFLNKNKINTPKTLLLDLKKIKKNKNKVYSLLVKNFGNKKIAIRSSFFNEDTKNTSNAGKYQSILNLDIKDKDNIFKNIKIVAKSYQNNSLKNQIIFQEMISDVKFSGVMTNLDIKNYSPHIKINFTKGKDTTLITSGKDSGNTLTFLPNNKYKPKNKIIIKLLKTIEKISEVLKIKFLDIEFIVTNKNKIIILQAREIILPKKTKIKSLIELQSNYSRIEKKIIKLQEKHYDLIGNTTYFGVMPDWNPAEIIGIKPKPLALSLYQELITDHVWSLNREKYGYKDLSSYHLMTLFYGTPYIDVRIDFNSWLPAKLNNRISEKLINYYLGKFLKNKKFHDKIEFEIIFSCFTFSTKQRLHKELKKNKFSKNEIMQIEKNLKVISKNNFTKIKDEILKIKNLIKKQNKVKKSNMYEIQKIYYLVEDCKKFGTLPFAGLARSGFVAIDLLNSMVEQKIISQKNKENFLASINGLTSRINNDLLRFNKLKFIKKYGHLRPNSYEISSLNYKDGYKFYFDKKNVKYIHKKKFQFEFNEKSKKRINSFLKEIDLKYTIKDFINFLKDAIFYREYSKFVFTKSIDLIFENLKKFSKKHNIDLHELSYTKISDFLEAYFSIDNQLVVKKIKDSIKENKQNFLKNSELSLPSIILNTQDLYLNENNNIIGNFITNEIVSGNVVNYNSFKKVNNIEGKIVLIENADPGYDFIFSKNIKGLITKFGGQNSHMSIRAAELRLPACIGVGEEKFEKLTNIRYLTLNCKNHHIS